MGETTTLDFQISYAEDAVSITAKIGPSPNQDRKQRVQTIDETLKHHNIAYELGNEEVRIAEKVLESFRVFEKQDKIKETKLYVNKKIASELEKKLKSIFPPPESAVSIRCGQSNAA